MIKKNIITIICCSVILIVLININPITEALAKMLENNPTLVIADANDYTKNYGFQFVDLSKDYVPYSYQDIKNIIFSAINNGWNTFTFYCPNEYEDCLKDVDEITDNDSLISHINNYVHPYNSIGIHPDKKDDENIRAMRTTISSSGEVTIYIEHFYNEEDILKINSEVEKIINNVIGENDDDYDKLKKIHDYLINNTKYDVSANDNKESKYDSRRANGVFFDHYATCNGYTDAMAIILSNLGFKNFKVSTSPEEISYESNGHIWNAVYFNNSWVHLDLTWDDPVSSDGKDYIYHKYFLVSNEEMLEADSGEVTVEEHNFNKTIYTEFKDNKTK